MYFRKEKNLPYCAKTKKESPTSVKAEDIFKNNFLLQWIMKYGAVWGLKNFYDWAGYFFVISGVPDPFEHSCQGLS